MEEALLNLYELELRYLQSMLREYRARNGKIADRLVIDDDGRCQDPWVQRLLEGFAFLAARIHRRMDDEFPRFTQGLIETIYPDFLCPIPSMGIFEFRPDGSVPELMAGKAIPRGTAIRNRVEGGDGSGSVCEFRTAHPVRMSSVVLGRIRYVTRDLESLRLPRGLAGARSALVLGLINLAPAPVSAVKLDELDFFVAVTGEARSWLAELLVAHSCGWVVRDPARPDAECLAHVASDTGDVVTCLGCSDGEALLPTDSRSFSGLRLLREYFSLPERLQFFRVRGFEAGLRKCSGKEADLVILFDAEMPQLARFIDEEPKKKGQPVGAVKLYCTPAVNLFPKEMLRIPLDQGGSELQLVADRFRDLDYEVHRVEQVEGVDDHGQRQPFRPFFALNEQRGSGRPAGGSSFYTLRRASRGPTLQEREAGAMRTYAGSEVFLTIVDAANAPYQSNLSELKVSCLCSNRHLPRELAPEVWHDSLVASPSPPYLKQVALIGRITEPQSTETTGEGAWKFIHHLSLNLADIAPPDDSPASGAGLRDVLRLQIPPTALAARQQIEGLVAVRIRPEIGRIEDATLPSFVRGHRVTLEIDESVFRGHSAVVFGAVVAQFLARHVAVNSFVETALWSIQRKQEIMRWPALLGSRRTI